MAASESSHIPASYLKELENLRIEVTEKGGRISCGVMVSGGSKFVILQDGGILTRVMIFCHNVASIRVVGDGK